MASPYVQDVNDWIRYYKQTGNNKAMVEGGGGLGASPSSDVANPVEKHPYIQPNSTNPHMGIVTNAQQAVVQARATQRVKRAYKKRKPVKRAKQKVKKPKQPRPSKKKVVRRGKKRERDLFDT